MIQDKLKVALIVDSLNVSKYVYELASWAIVEKNIELTCLIIQDVARGMDGSSFLSKVKKHLRDKGLRSLLTNFCWRLILRIEELKLRMSPVHADHLSFRKLDLDLSQIVVSPNISESGFVYRYNNEDLEKIRNKQLDILIRCGSGILKGDILNASRYGVVSFHHGDNRVNRGGPAGFWEVYQRQSRTGFIIQRLTEELDGGDIIFRGYFPTAASYLLNQANLYSRSNYYMKEVLKKISRKKNLPDAEPNYPYSYQLYRMPDLKIQANYFIRVTLHFFVARIKSRLLGRQQRWGVAFQRVHWRNLVMWRSIKVANPPRRFLADPFIISRDGMECCFVEDYDYSTKRGCISIIRLDGAKARSIEKVIIESFHMSFPYLFEYEKGLFMVPETCENKDIRVYECIEFPSKWRLRSILMKDVYAADTMIFYKEGLWWLLTNINPQGEGDLCSELSIFYSRNPLGMDWTPHKENPICIDPSKARNGGILFEGEHIYRVAQKYGFNQYGAEANIFRIDELNNENYVETLVANIKPKFFNGLGTHHLHSNGKITVFDYVVEEKI